MNVWSDRLLVRAKINLEMSKNWKCRFCKCELDLASQHRVENSWPILTPSPHQLTVIWTVCPNRACQEVSLVAKLYSGNGGDGTGEAAPPKQIEHWRLLPRSNAATFPEYIPKHLIEDYKEAWAIIGLSPKACAILARRCLHGLVRDFWKTKPGQLVDEIAQIKDKIEPQVWEAVEAVRKVGNFGAHFAENISENVEVRPQDVQHLLKVIEMLFRDWYVARAEKQQRLEKLRSLAEGKTTAKGKAPSVLVSTT